jgi:hypothetical protein
MSIDASRPPRPQVGEITTHLRRAILRYADERAKRQPNAIWTAYREREYYGSLPDAIDGVCERYGLDRGAAWNSLNAEVERFAEGAERLADPLERRIDLDVGADERLHNRVFTAEGPRLFLLWAPDQEFLSALEAIDRIVRAYHTNRRGRTTPGWPSITRYADQAFAAHGVPWRLGRDGFEWSGDPGVAETVLAPALGALADPRLAGARAEFERALGALRRGGTDAFEQAVGDSGKSVESALESVLVTYGVDFNDRDGARRRWQLLCEAGILPAWSEHAVLGASLPRNRESAHGAGMDPRQVAEATATAAVGAAAVAITLLSGHLPSMS